MEIKRLLLHVLVALLAVSLRGKSDAATPVESDAGKTPLPTDFPVLKRDFGLYFLTSNGSGMESTLAKLYWANAELLKRLSAHTANSIATTFGERMEKEQDMHIKLLLAMFAARNGHKGARKFIEKAAETTDYSITLSRFTALRHLVNAENPEEWVFDAIHRALSDTRQVTDIDRQWQTGTKFEISYLADEFEHLTFD